MTFGASAGHLEDEFDYAYEFVEPPHDPHAVGLGAIAAVGLFTVVKGIDTVLDLAAREPGQVSASTTVRPTTLASLAAAALVAVALLLWIYRARKNLDAFYDATPRWSIGWTIGALFIPCANIVLFPVVLADVARWSVAGGGVGRSHRVVALIWTCLAFFLLASFSSGFVNSFAQASGPSAGRVVIGLVLGVLAGVLLMVVIHMITAEQRARIAAASVPAYGDNR